MSELIQARLQGSLLSRGQPAGQHTLRRGHKRLPLETRGFAPCTGLGLLLLRLVTCAMLLIFEWHGLALTKAPEDHTTIRISLAILLIFGSALVLLGLLTRISSLVVAFIEGAWALCSAVISIAGSSDHWLYSVLIVGNLSTLMLSGPGGFPWTRTSSERVSALYETHRDRICCFLMRKGLTAIIAQEVTQDVFVDLFLTLKKGTRIESVQRWLYAVAGRTALDHWRRKRYRMRIDFDLDPAAEGDVPSREPTPEAHAEHKERLNRVAAGLQKLPKQQRLCIQLRAQGMHYREIAEVLRISTSTAGEWIISAMGRLREQANSNSPLSRRLTPDS